MHTQTAATLKQQSYSFQLITVGNPSVGKTSLIHRIAYQKFPETIEPTLAVSELPVVITTDKGNAIANLPLQIALNETIGKYLNKNQIYIGEQK
jgi:GTPase SAR1 family protein